MECTDTRSEIAFEPLITLASVQKHVVEWAPREEDMISLARFRGGNLPLGTIRARWTLLQAMKDAQISNITDMSHISLTHEDETHFCGLHAPIIRSHWRSLFSRIISAPEVKDFDPSMIEYVTWVADESRMFIYHLDQISRWAHRTRNTWRFQARSNIWVDRTREVAQYPFLPKQFTPSLDHDLLLLAHKLIPKSFPPELRGDLCQDFIVEMLTGELNPADAADELKPFLKRTLKKYPRKYGDISIETQVFEGKTLADMLEDRPWGTVRRKGEAYA